MKFPNAEKGIRKIFTAEILGLISAIGVAITAILASNMEDAASSLKVAIIVCGALTGVLMLISYIINIVGVTQASKDEF